MTQPTPRDKLAAALYGHPRTEQYLDAYRVDVLREAANAAERENAECPVTTAGRPCPPCAARAAGATKLRRMAEEALS